MAPASPLVTFTQSHIPEITGTTLLATYATLRHKLTPLGTLSGIAVATLHMLHPSPAYFWLLIVFFALGTLVTRIGRTAKLHLTQASTGGTGGEGPRTSAQVFANSGTACVWILVHAWLVRSSPWVSGVVPLAAGPHWPVLERVLPVGILAQYAAVAADTFSSELGILARSPPVLVTAPWKRVPRGTNGGVTVEGLLYGLLGGFLLTATAGVALRFLPPYVGIGLPLGCLVTLMGLVGSLVDSVLGATVQATVVDRGSGRVVEGPGGKRVKVVEGGSRVVEGRDLLTNNGVNFTMAFLASLLAMGSAYVLGLGL
ncbi:hypothetical protein EJ03DRAFT_355300 [Teratosphaeria nubilosa]|uniref:DUF92-domain-containing protein n=1 Tax=Teratosphaeria nubilosa TaxID=161662 RepID=A0A6G1KWJ5_9PEZI|nr:hypothetical protein EJ03DRAFT_355300 [Teratosphaeria nubilosa]